MKVVITSAILSGLDQKNHLFEEQSWSKFNNLGLALGIALTFFSSMAKGLKLKVRNFGGLVPTFVEVTREKQVGSLFEPHPPPSAPYPTNLNRFNWLLCD